MCPFLATCRLETNLHRTRNIPDLHEELAVAFCGVGKANVPTTRCTQSVEPISGNIYADHVCHRY